MIRLLTFVLVLVAGHCELRAGTVLHYKFDEGPLNQPASVVLDSGPNNIPGTAHKIGAASLPTYRSAPAGFQLEFSGQGEAVPTAASYIEVTDPGVSPLDLTGPLTVEAFIRPTLIDHMEIARKRGGLAGSGYFLDIDSSGHLRFRLQDDATAAIGATALAAFESYHVAGTWDGSTIRVYVNYTLDGQFAYNGPLNANNDKLGIGALLRNNVRISDSALAPNEFLPVPEPSTMILALLAALPAVLRRSTRLFRSL